MEKLPPIASFLEDISPSLPVGEYLKYDETYDAIKEARRFDDTLPQGIWTQDLKSSDWGKVALLSIEALQKRSKDIQICAWLLEAWIFLHGFDGAEHGFEVLEKLSQKYWDTLYPQIEEKGDKEFRVSSYVWINEKLSERLKFIAVSSPEDALAQPIKFSDYIAIKPYWRAGDNASVSVPKDKVQLLAIFENSIATTKKEFFETFKKQCENLIQKTNDIERFLAEKCYPDEGPTLQRVRAVLGEMIVFFDQVLWFKRVPEASPEASKDITPSQNSAPASGISSAVVLADEKGTSLQGFNISSLVKSREEAYQVIRHAADYLERLDPHSPVPYMLKRAVSWGTLPLKDLLQEIIKEPQVLSEVKTLLGLGDGGTP